ncbi:MAG: thioredoxin [Proteobacteria bacterium]|nr:thioredoxin [Pseudomonadota bacterium]
MIRWVNVLFAAALWLPLFAVAGPDLVLQGLDGRNRAVSEFIGHGQWTVVAIWSADCPICRRDMPEMAFFHDAHRHKDAIVLGVSIDGGARKPEIAGFIEDHALDFVNLIGTPMQMAAFGGPFRGTPTYYIYSPKGNLVTRQVGSMTQEAAEEIILHGNMAGY